MYAAPAFRCRIVRRGPPLSPGGAVVGGGDGAGAVGRDDDVDNPAAVPREHVRAAAAPRVHTRAVKSSPAVTAVRPSAVIATAHTPANVEASRPRW